jgi:YgiT-type zinc finger domain-containing protein
MNCIICRQADYIDGLTSVPFERDEFRLLIKNVPAQVCPNCGEALVEEKVGIQLLRFADAMFDMGIIENICEYSEVATKNIS